MIRRVVVPVLLLGSLAACGGVTDPSKNKNETFTGTIQPGGGGATHTFNVSNSGEISAVVTDLTPTVASGTLFEVLFGQLVSNQCSILSANQFAVVGGTALSGPITPGSYCIQIVDEGYFRVAENYTLTVSHP